MRREFSTTVRKAALKRSGYLCEAEGSWYNLPAGRRCNASLDNGVEYDHLILEANSKDASLENCRAVCIPCHRYKTAHHDIPLAAKTRAQSNMRKNLKPPSFARAIKEQKTRKEPLAPRALYRTAQ